MAIATIQIIKNISPIEGADRIEVARVLGWDCIIKKGSFKIGDMCIYVEPDTIIPKKFVDDACDTDEKIRLRTIKMRGQISQGLILPANILGWVEKAIIDKVGVDVSECLGITKYEKPMPPHLQGVAEGMFPRFLRKTDEVRIQSVPEYIDILWDKPYYITTKLDGTSATFYRFNGKFGVCSRNLELKDGENVYWQMVRKYQIADWLPEGTCIQGEIVGQGIQGNKMGLPDVRLFMFNVFDINEQKYKSIFDDVSCIPTVPIEEIGGGFRYTLPQIISRSIGNYENGEPKEGMVVRSMDSAISFKVINTDFLLRWNE